MSSDKKYIYTLIDPRTDTPFYVGATINPGARLSNHIGESLDRDNRGKSCHFDCDVDGNVHIGKKKQFLIGDILKAGLRPVMEIVEECPNESEAWSNAEIFWYERMTSMGHELLQRKNLLGDRGGRSSTVTPSSRKKRNGQVRRINAVAASSIA